MQEQAEKDQAEHVDQQLQQAKDFAKRLQDQAEEEQALQDEKDFQHEQDLQDQVNEQQEQRGQQLAFRIAEGQRLAAEGYQRCQPDWGKRSLDRYRDGVTSCSKAATNFNIKHLLSIAIP